MPPVGGLNDERGRHRRPRCCQLARHPSDVGHLRAVLHPYRYLAYEDHSDSPAAFFTQPPCVSSAFALHGRFNSPLASRLIPNVAPFRSFRFDQECFGFAFCGDQLGFFAVCSVDRFFVFLQFWDTEASIASGVIGRVRFRGGLGGAGEGLGPGLDGRDDEARCGGGLRRRFFAELPEGRGAVLLDIRGGATDFKRQDVVAGEAEDRLGREGSGELAGLGDERRGGPRRPCCRRPG